MLNSYDRELTHKSRHNVANIFMHCKSQSFKIILLIPVTWSKNSFAFPTSHKKKEESMHIFVGYEKSKLKSLRLR